MAQIIADRKDILFVLLEQFKVQEFSRHDTFSEFNKKTIELIINEARNIAVKEILPTQKIGDAEGVELSNFSVRVPEEFHRAYKMYAEGGWIAMSDDPGWEGQGMPNAVSMGVNDYLVGANHALNMIITLTHGTGKLIEKFGTEKQKELFVTNLYSGKWAGTMLLTEPEAGSDLGALQTTAYPNPDGTYSLSGTKIFSSGGDHDLTENIIHPVLARIQGAPSGTKGVSVFIVPKYWVNDDGSLGEFNDVVCSGIEDKMGIHGCPTCTLSLGDKGNCTGLLLGQDNNGIGQMFLMMNAARLKVGIQGLSSASSSYLYATNYARQRIQGRDLLDIKDKNSHKVPIIQHPDVRRMLWTMKVYVESIRSLLYYVALCEDLKYLSKNREERERYQDIVDFLTPICKGYCTDRSFDVCNFGVQIYGGYGYIKEYPVEQLLRDCRINGIYEGTNGIQAMDLLGRKLSWNQGKAFKSFLEEIYKTVSEAKDSDHLSYYAHSLRNAVNKLEQAAELLSKKSKSQEIKTAYANAYPFMEVCGDIALAWMLFWRSVVCIPKIDKKHKNVQYYKGQVKNLQFFFDYIFPQTLCRLEVMLKEDCAKVVEDDEDLFGGK